MDRTKHKKIVQTAVASVATWQSWNHMRGRCKNKNSDSYHHYGGRGIGFCESWNSFENFVADMGLRPANTSLDRIDANGNYCKENCRWASTKIQTNNKRNTIKITHQGKTLSLKEWAELLGLNHSTLYYRIKRSGWKPEDALVSTVYNSRWIWFNGSRK